MLGEMEWKERGSGGVDGEDVHGVGKDGEGGWGLVLERWGGRLGVVSEEMGREDVVDGNDVGRTGDGVGEDGEEGWSKVDKDNESRNRRKKWVGDEVRRGRGWGIGALN